MYAERDKGKRSTLQHQTRAHSHSQSNRDRKSNRHNVREPELVLTHESCRSGSAQQEKTMVSKQGTQHHQHRLQPPPPTRSQPTPSAAAPLCGMVLFQALTERLPLKTGFCKSDTSQIVTGRAVSVDRRQTTRRGGGQRRASLTALVALTARHPSNKSHTTLPPPPLFLSGRAHLRG